MKKPMNSRQAADTLGLTDARVRQLCIAGKIPGAFKLGRDWMIPEASVLRLNRERNGNEEKRRKR